MPTYSRKQAINIRSGTCLFLIGFGFSGTMVSPARNDVCERFESGSEPSISFTVSPSVLRGSTSSPAGRKFLLRTLRVILGAT